MRPQKVKKSLTRISKRGQVLPLNEDETRAGLPSLDYELELFYPMTACGVVARGQNVLLLDPQWLSLE